MYKSYSKNNYCKCGRLICNNAKRCRKCSKMGKNNPFYAKHHNKKTKKIMSKKTEERYSNPKNHSRYIDGRTLKKYYCKDCDKKITYPHKRCLSCAGKVNSKKYKGKNHWNYIDGRSEFPYPFKFSSKLKEQIRKRDNYHCQGENCSMTQEEHFIVYGRDLEIHHIDYNKQNCNDNNLITLCRQCNVRANFNRNYWKEYFSKIGEKNYESA